MASFCFSSAVSAAAAAVTLITVHSCLFPSAVSAAAAAVTVMTLHSYFSSAVSVAAGVTLIMVHSCLFLERCIRCCCCYSDNGTQLSISRTLNPLLLL